MARTADQLNTLAEIALDEADPDKARRYAEESLADLCGPLPARAPGRHHHAGPGHGGAGRHAAAGRVLADALAASGRHGQSLATAQCLRVAGVLAEAGASPALAVRLFAAAQALSPSPTGTTTRPRWTWQPPWAGPGPRSTSREVEREWTLGGALPLSTMLTQLDEAIGLNGS